MRIIAGTFRGRRLATFKGSGVRPTPDRVREALFSILRSRLGHFTGLKVLDLYAGSGALAIESLSRGASSACLVEKSTSSAQIIRDNLDLCQITDNVKLIPREVLSTLRSLEGNTYNVIFIDPPYGQGLAEQTLARVEQYKLLSEDGILCAETGVDETLPEAVGQLQQIERRRYGSVVISLYGHAS
jgi:16S rRNA (guanine(966)-N(2))-methyltransferase RsmD